jgi:DNA-binding NarL/FixJ family response regulator
MKIVLCSRQDSVRERWYTVLADQGYRIYQVAFLESLKQLLLRDDTYLILLHQPFADFQTIAELCDKAENWKVFVLADEPSDEDGLSLLQRGVVGYTNTYIAPARLVEAVKVVLFGRVWVGQRLLQMLIRSTAGGGRGVPEKSGVLLEKLSPREVEIARLVAEGLSNQAIADQLFISDRTVKSHLSTIFSKTGTQSRLQLALLILRQE